MKTSKAFAAFAAFGALALAASFTANVYAQTAMSKDSMPGMTMDTAATVSTTDGEVRKIDKENQKITLKHGNIKNLDMPGMTMVFKARDAAMLDKVQVGSKVKFMAEKADGALVVTSLEVAQ